MKSLPNPINNATFLTTVRGKSVSKHFLICHQEMGKKCYHFFPALPSPYNVFCPFCTFWSLFGHSRAFLSVPHFLALSSFVTNVIFTFLYVCTFTKKSPRFPFRKKRKKCLPPNIVYQKKDLMVRKKVRQSIGNQDFFFQICALEEFNDLWIDVVTKFVEKKTKKTKSNFGWRIGKSSKSIKIEFEIFFGTERPSLILFIFAHCGIFSLILANSQDGHPSTLTFHSSAFTLYPTLQICRNRLSNLHISRISTSTARG